jgi:hypothetical protein
MNNMSGSLFDTFLHDVPTAPGIAQTSHKDLPKRRRISDFFQPAVVHLVISNPAPHLRQ